MFRTELDIKKSQHKVSLNEPILTIGSCFADNIGDALAEHKFNVIKNPFGVVFNPLSIFQLLDYAIKKEYPLPDSYLKINDIYFNYEIHSDFSALSHDSLVDQVERCIDSVSIILPMTKWVILTFGTAIIYERKDIKKLVANCHKVPASEFNRKMLSQKQIIQNFERFHSNFKKVNPNGKIILTVIPVRHLKESSNDNSVSKSTLRIVSNTLSSIYDDVEYFPAYEIMMDDLRDYRFYEKDMLHPNQEAREYIWEKFAACYFDKGTSDFISEWGKLSKALKHKPFHPESKQHKEFLSITLEKLEKFAHLIDVNQEIDTIKSQLDEKGSQ